MHVVFSVCLYNPFLRMLSFTITCHSDQIADQVTTHCGARCCKYSSTVYKFFFTISFVACQFQGSDHVNVWLSVRVGGRDLVTTNFTFFDCARHASCGSCVAASDSRGADDIVRGDFPCYWCIQRHICTHSIEGDCMRYRSEIGISSYSRKSIKRNEPPV